MILAWSAAGLWIGFCLGMTYPEIGALVARGQAWLAERRARIEEWFEDKRHP